MSAEIQPESLVNAFTVDVEDYFHVQAFESTVSRAAWPTLELRVERSAGLLLDLLAEKHVHATFFVLAWVAERCPSLVRRITGEGHELASHGCLHQRVTDLTREAFAADVRASKRFLEDLGGCEVLGYRAPSFSINSSNLWALDELQAAGYRYSSSIYPGHHDIYGMPEAPRFGFLHGPGPLREYPATTVQIGRLRMSCAGGGFFRLWPYRLFRSGLRRVNRADRESAIFYVHPWEVDPDQPRFRSAPFRSRFRHYLNLDRVEPRLRRLLGDFRWDRMDRVFGLR